MNKKLIFAFCTAMLCFGCEIQDGKKMFSASATIYLKNETSSVIRSESGLGYEIQSGEIVVHKESETMSLKRPTVDTYQPFSGEYVFYYIDESKCEVGLTDIENYENRKEVSPLHFELTFRFTEEKKANAEPCTIPVLD